MIIRLAGLLLGLSATIAVGAPGNDGALIEKKVFPPAKEGDLWWGSVRDICEIVGTQFEGEGFTIEVLGNGAEVRVWGQIVGNGPFKIKVGEDTYEFRLDKPAIGKNGEPFGDFLMQPKRIEGVVCATLEDLSRILGFEIGDEVHGQPTITKDGKQYRLVKGEPRGAFRFTPVDADNWRAEAEELQRRFGDAPLIGPKRLLRPGDSLVIPSQPVGPYTEHNGMLYRRGTVQLHMGPTVTTPGGAGGETLFGPVVPNRFHAEGVSADLLYLSIVKRQARTGGVVRMGPVPPKAEPRGYDEQGRPVR